MSRDETYGKVMEIIGRYAKNKDALEGASEDTNILEDLKVNSARLVDVILDFEDEFDIEVDDEDADAVNTVGDVASCAECLGGIFHHLLRIAEDDASRLGLQIEQAAHDFDLRTVAHFVVFLVDGIDCQGFALDADLLRIAAKRSDQAFYPFVHRGGEEECLSVLG